MKTIVIFDHGFWNYLMQPIETEEGQCWLNAFAV